MFKEAFGLGFEVADFLHDFGEVAERLVDVEVLVEGDFVANDGFAFVDPGVRDVGQDFLVEIGFDTAWVDERDVFGIAAFAVRLVDGGAAVFDDGIPGAGGEALLLGVDFQIEFLGDNGRGLGIAPGNGVEDGLELGCARLELEFLERGFDVLGEEGEVIPCFLGGCWWSFPAISNSSRRASQSLGSRSFFRFAPVSSICSWSSQR